MNRSEENLYRLENDYHQAVENGELDRSAELKTVLKIARKAFSRAIIICFEWCRGLRNNG